MTRSRFTEIVRFFQKGLFSDNSKTKKNGESVHTNSESANFFTYITPKKESNFFHIKEVFFLHFDFLIFGHVFDGGLLEPNKSKSQIFFIN